MFGRKAAAVLQIRKFWQSVMSRRVKRHVAVEYETEKQPLANSGSKKSNSQPNKNWKQIIENIRTMRNNHPAAVDEMGCEKCCDNNADDKTKRFQILVALMMSSQTKDAVTFGACQRLKTLVFAPENIAKMDIDALADIIKPVSFHKTKAKHIKMSSQILLDNFLGDIPNTIEGLLKLPGVGKKVAHICMSSAWNITGTGIGVDTHVHRISNRLKFTSKPTKDPEKTRTELETWLPHDLWSDINLLMVGFGQTICTPTSPKCSECLNNKICPSAVISPAKKAKSKTT